jgi:hypothetical protein
MRAIICNLLIAVVLIPALLGWCCRPSASEASCCTVAKVSHESCHHQHTDCDDHQQVPCKSHSECKGICSYLSTPKFQFDSSSKAYGLAFLSPESRPTLAQLLAVSYLAERLDLTNLTAPPLRIHVVNQIWLI